MTSVTVTTDELDQVYKDLARAAAEANTILGMHTDKRTNAYKHAHEAYWYAESARIRVRNMIRDAVSA